MSDLFSKIKQERFIANNGRVLRAINVLRIRYVKLKELQAALSDEINECDYMDCVNYLSEQGYIKLRHIKTKEETSLADADITVLEGKLSGKGVQLLAGKINDSCIDV